ncbi:hypothetical protein COCVIDRAFT_88916, partial [Bipolaris victoriae FI3]
FPLVCVWPVHGLASLEKPLPVLFSARCSFGRRSTSPNLRALCRALELGVVSFRCAYRNRVGIVVPWC